MNATENAVSLPSIATRAAVLAVLEADKGLSPKHRARVLAVLDAPDGSPDRAAGWVPASVAAAQIGVHLSTLGRWIEAGKVHARHEVGERVSLVSLAEVSAFAAAHPNRKRGSSTSTAPATSTTPKDAPRRTKRPPTP